MNKQEESALIVTACMAGAALVALVAIICKMMVAT